MSAQQPRRQQSLPAPASLPRIDEKDKELKSGWSEESFSPQLGPRSPASTVRKAAISISTSNLDGQKSSGLNNRPPRESTEDFVLVDDKEGNYPPVDTLMASSRPDKASRLLGIKHRASMEPIPAASRASVASARSVPTISTPPVSTSPLCSLYVVSGLPKSPQTWTLADPDSVLGLNHSENAVGRWWRPEVLGSTVSPGVGGTVPLKKRGKKSLKDDAVKGVGALSKSEVGKMLSKTLKVHLLTPASGSPSLTVFVALIHSRGGNHRFHLTTAFNYSYVHFQSSGGQHGFAL
jgi:hypothetical protein